jgi:hypothetical protein
MFMDIKTEMGQLRNEMTETRALIKQYNGLREEVKEAVEKTDKVDSKLNGIVVTATILIPLISLLVSMFWRG